MDDKLQNEELATADLADHARRRSERAQWEDTWSAIDDRFPTGAGGFRKVSQGGIRGAANYDTTHTTAVERFAAAGVAITTPAERDYIRPRFADEELMKIRSVKLWCQAAGRRLYAIRHNWRTGFGVAANEDWDQLGRYGTSPFWTDVRPDGGGMFYRVLHLSEVTIDVDYCGEVDTIDRCYTRTVRQLEQFFGRENLTEKMIRALEDKKPHTEFEILHIVTPNREWDAEKLDWRRMPIASRYLAMDEKVFLRRRG